jgi:hypothetical protein
MWPDPSDLTPELVTQNPDSSNQKHFLAGGKLLTPDWRDIGTTVTNILDGSSVPTALHHVVRLNVTGFPVILPSLLS